MELDFEFFYKWVKSNLNLDLDAYKENQLQRRIATVMRSAGVSTLQEYAKLIGSDIEVKRIFLDYITINVTEFFRNKEIFQEFEDVLVNVLVPKFRNVKIWSAACSIGAEPYSIAMIMDKHNLTKNTKIVATDIDDNILKRAKEGVYKQHETKGLTKEDLAKHFNYDDNTYSIYDNLKEIVSFKKHDLILDNYEKGFHAVVCRNVFIYFKDETKNEIYKKIYDSLVPGGVFFIGATESIYNPKNFGFKKLSTFIYEKV